MGEEQEETKEEKPLTRDDVLRLIEALATKEKGHELVLNRECVLRLIEENGGLENELDLSEMKFDRGIDLHDIDLKRIILTKARLVEVHLENANLREVHLEEANLRYAHLERADLSEAHLRGASLMKANLEMANLRGANLKDANLKEADLSYAHLEGASLFGSNLERAYLFSGNLKKVNLIRANLKWAHLDNTHLEEADLSEANLEGAYLQDANLAGSHLKLANLEKANLFNSDLRVADLSYANLKEADLALAHLKWANLFRTEFSSNTRLQGIDWGNYILYNETREHFPLAVHTYQQLKTWHTNAGMYDIAGQFFFREMTAKRKALDWWPKPWNRAWSKFLSLICGYGERPLRVIGWAGSVVLGLALIYFLIGSVWEWWAFWNSLYFSAVSFTALGYGKWADMASDWIRGIGAFESFIGVFTIALFLITFTRKMTR